MLIPDNIHPDQTVYLNGAFVLATIQEHRVMGLLELYIATESEREMSVPVFLLCLDWLFLIDLIELTSDGKVKLCT